MNCDKANNKRRLRQRFLKRNLKRRLVDAETNAAGEPPATGSGSGSATYIPVGFDFIDYKRCD